MPPRRHRKDINFSYVKFRKDFGRPTDFTAGVKTIVNIHPDPRLRANFIQLNPRTYGTQMIKSCSLHEVNTKTSYSHKSMSHKEGGWKKDMFKADLETYTRAIKEIEKDEALEKMLPKAYEKLRFYLTLNNTMNIHTEYFQENYWKGRIPLPPLEKTVLPVKTFSDPAIDKRPARYIDFHPKDNIMMTTHSGFNYYEDECELQDTTCYLWDIEWQIHPIAVLDATVPCVSLEFNLDDPNFILGGYRGGQVAVFDRRMPSRPTIFDKVFDTCVTSALWTHSKSGKEFFAGSMAGQIHWYDVRRLKQPLDQIVLDFRKEDEEVTKGDMRFWGVSCLSYESSIPVKFMVGTWLGQLLIGSKKGETMQEKITARFDEAHVGPIKNIKRNPFINRSFISAGDFTVKVWVEGCKTNVFWTSGSTAEVAGCDWSYARAAVFYIAYTDGVLEGWDLMLDTCRPVIRKQLRKPFMTLKGLRKKNLDVVAVGDTNGDITMYKFSEYFLSTDREEKRLMNLIIDQGIKCEKSIESQNRERKVKEIDLEKKLREGLGVDPEEKLKGIFQEVADRFKWLITKKKQDYDFRPTEEMLEECLAGMPLEREEEEEEEAPKKEEEVEEEDEVIDEPSDLVKIEIHEKVKKLTEGYPVEPEWDDEEKLKVGEGLVEREVVVEEAEAEDDEKVKEQPPEEAKKEEVEEEIKVPVKIMVEGDLELELEILLQAEDEGKVKGEDEEEGEEEGEGEGKVEGEDEETEDEDIIEDEDEEEDKDKDKGIPNDESTEEEFVDSDIDINEDVGGDKKDEDEDEDEEDEDEDEDEDEEEEEEEEEEDDDDDDEEGEDVSGDEGEGNSEGEIESEDEIKEEKKEEVSVEESEEMYDKVIYFDNLGLFYSSSSSSIEEEPLRKFRTKVKVKSSESDEQQEENSESKDEDLESSDIAKEASPEEESESQKEGRTKESEEGRDEGEDDGGSIEEEEEASDDESYYTSCINEWTKKADNVLDHLTDESLDDFEVNSQSSDDESTGDTNQKKRKTS